MVVSLNGLNIPKQAQKNGEPANWRCFTAKDPPAQGSRFHPRFFQEGDFFRGKAALASNENADLGIFGGDQLRQPCAAFFIKNDALSGDVFCRLFQREQAGNFGQDAPSGLFGCFVFISYISTIFALLSSISILYFLFL